jgi:protein-S-isoprenylcysteine O-methyltransferase Ste14
VITGPNRYVRNPIYLALVAIVLALQLPFMQVSESMGNHDSKIVDAASVD